MLSDKVKGCHPLKLLIKAQMSEFSNVQKRVLGDFLKRKPST